MTRAVGDPPRHAAPTPAPRDAVAKERGWVWLLPWLALSVSGSDSLRSLGLGWQYGVGLVLGCGAGALWQVLRPRDFVERLLPLAWFMVLGLAVAAVTGPQEQRLTAEGVCGLCVLAGLVICEDVQRRLARRR